MTIELKFLKNDVEIVIHPSLAFLFYFVLVLELILTEFYIHSCFQTNDAGKGPRRTPVKLQLESVEVPWCSLGHWFWLSPSSPSSPATTTASPDIERDATRTRAISFKFEFWFGFAIFFGFRVSRNRLIRRVSRPVSWLKACRSFRENYEI